MTELNENIWENLKSADDRHCRLNALKDLERFCDTTKDLQKIISTFDACYLHLLNCFADKYESCREQSARTVAAFMRALPVNDFYLQNVVVTMTGRIGKAEMIEESEEIRLLHIGQLEKLIEKYKRSDECDYLGQCYEEIINILFKALADPYPAIQKEACGCVVKLSKATPMFHQRAEHLMKPLFSMLSHKHSQNRIAAVEACYMVALHINPNSEMLPRIFVETSPLLMDSMPLVRRECGRMGCLMLMELRDRYSFFDRIIPLVLCCLKDDSPEVKAYILPLWKECGKQYYDENEQELRKLEIGEKISENYPKWEKRPTIGCRALVQRSLRLLGPIMRETYDWKENVRLHALRLLYQFVLHAEAAMTAKFFEIYLDLAKACSDTEAAVANEAMKAADLMGRLLSYADWKEHGIEGLEKNPRLGHVRCFYHLYAGATECDVDDILRISEIIVIKDFSQNMKFDFQLYVLRLVDELLRKYSLRTPADAMANLSMENSNVFERNLYTIVLRVMALSFEQDKEKNHIDLGQELLEKISKSNNTSVSELHTRHLNSVLEQMDDLDAFLDSLTEPILLLCGILHICAFRPASLDLMKRNILTVWQNAADDAKVKVFSAISIAMLTWNATMDIPQNESEEELQKFTVELIEEHLAWKVGAAAESMRSLATATLCAMTQGASGEATQVLPKMVKYFTNLLEDNAVSTRIYALKCLLNFGEVECDLLRSVGYSVLQRLDDPHSGTRELAATVIPKLKPICPTKEDDDTWHAFIKKAMSTLFLYFDGPEIKLRDVIKDVLIELGQMYPDTFEEPLNCALATSFQKQIVEEIKKAVHKTS